MKKRYRGAAVWLGLALVLSLSLAGCDEEGSNWRAMTQLRPPAGGPRITLSLSRQVLVGDYLTLDVASSAPGRLWVVAIDQDDHLTLLFPNQADPDNAMAANHSMLVPRAGARWAIQAAEPVGRTLYGVFVTTGNTDLRAVLSGVEAGGLAKSLTLAQVPDSWGVARGEVSVLARPAR